MFSTQRYGCFFVRIDDEPTDTPCLSVCSDDEPADTCCLPVCADEPADISCFSVGTDDGLADICLSDCATDEPVDNFFCSICKIDELDSERIQVPMLAALRPDSLLSTAATTASFSRIWWNLRVKSPFGSCIQRVNVCAASTDEGESSSSGREDCSWLLKVLFTPSFDSNSSRCARFWFVFSALRSLTIDALVPSSCLSTDTLLAKLSVSLFTDTNCFTS